MSWCRANPGKIGEVMKKAHRKGVRKKKARVRQERRQKLALALAPKGSKPAKAAS
jgi:hypothetical protein